MSADFKRALVTGGAGFIGSHLVDALVADGCEVNVLDNFSTGNERNLASSRDRIRLIRGDIRDRGALDEAVDGCEVVFHLAAVVSVVQTTEDPMGSAAINETGSLQVLEAARSAAVRRFIFTSSCAVYGDEPTLPKREDMRPNPLTPYAVQKLAIEHYLGVYQSVYGMETVALRFFNVFGPRQDPSSPYSGVISIFMLKALGEEPPTIFGDGLQTRDFVFVSDVIQALTLAARSASSPGQVFNVGTGESVTINELWKKIAALSGTRSAPVRAPQRAGEVVHSRSSIDMARERLSYAPRVLLGAGLAETMEWYRSAHLG
jgi:UDP-glucose 4-epimerase